MRIRNAFLYRAAVRVADSIFRMGLLRRNSVGDRIL
jgi:hypothetical protein